MKSCSMKKQTPLPNPEEKLSKPGGGDARL